MATKPKTTEAPAPDETKTDAGQVDGNETENAGLQADGADAGNADAQVDGSPSTDADGAPELTRTAGQGDDAVVVKATDEIDASVYDSTGAADEYVTLTKDVVEEFYYPDTKRPSHRLLFTKGQVVRKSVIDDLNANVEAKRAVVK